MPDSVRPIGRRGLVRVVSSAVVLGGVAPFLAACGSKAAPAASSTTTVPVVSKSSSVPTNKTTLTTTTSGYPPLSSNPLMNLTAPQASGTVSIKGAIDSTWSKAQQYTISATSPQVLAVGSLFSTTPPMKESVCYLQWDNNNLYVAEVRTQEPAGLPITDPHINVQMYLGNSLGVFFCTADPTATSNQYAISGHYTAWGTPRGPSGNHTPHIWLRAGDNGTQNNTHPSWPIAATITSTGYTMTMAIPWSALQVVPFKVQQGARAYFTLLATAAAPSGKPWGQIMLVGNGDVATTWGILTLAA